MINKEISKNTQQNKQVTVSQLMQAPFATGSLIVNFNQNQITLDGEKLVLQPKVVELLIILCATNGKTISKQELIEQLWPDTIVGPDSLANTMTRLRKALNDDAKNPQFIKTVQRKGYLWLPPVKNVTKSNRALPSKKSMILLSILLFGCLLYFTFPSAPEPEKFPFPDLSIKKLDQGGYEIEVGIDGKLTKEKEKAMLEELKRITGEESSGMVFTVDDIPPYCTDKNNKKQPCTKDENK